jgi:hypothetical protein
MIRLGIAADHGGFTLKGQVAVVEALRILDRAGFFLLALKWLGCNRPMKGSA